MNKTELCNLALLTIGSKNISDFDESTYHAGVVRQFYPTVKQRVLREHVWNCALTRQSLAQLADGPAFEYSYAFQLPTDCVKAVQLNSTAEPFHIEQDRLVTDSATADLLYVADINEAYLDPHVEECIQYALASELANPLAKNVNMSQALYEKYRRSILPRAKHTDAVESHGDQFYKGFFEVENRGPRYTW